MLCRCNKKIRRVVYARHHRTMPFLGTWEKDGVSKESAWRLLGDVSSVEVAFEVACLAEIPYGPIWPKGSVSSA